MISFVVINIHEYLNLIVCVLNHSVKDLASIWYNIWYSTAKPVANIRVKPLIVCVLCVCKFPLLYLFINNGKYDNLLILPLSKRAMYQHLLHTTKFCILEEFLAEIQVNFYTPLFFLQFLSIVSCFHKYYENTQKIICISDSPEKTLMTQN